MQLPARIGLITLACRDVERMRNLFRNLGWPETAESDEHHRTFACTNGVAIALYAASNYEQLFGETTREFRGVVLAINLASYDEVVSVFDTIKSVPDVEILDEPTEVFWGGGFSWRDPEGNIWDVAYANGTTIDDRGGVHFP